MLDGPDMRSPELLTRIERRRQTRTLRQSPVIAWNTASAATAAVSARSPLGPGARGCDRQQRGGPELGRLFDQPFEPLLADRRKEQPEIGLGPSLAQLPLGYEACRGNPAQPFALLRIERGDRGAWGKPQHI